MKKGDEQIAFSSQNVERSSEGDIEYLRDAFALGDTDEEAAAYFAKLINASLHTKTTVINDVIHVFAHR